MKKKTYFIIDIQKKTPFCLVQCQISRVLDAHLVHGFEKILFKKYFFETRQLYVLKNTFKIRKIFTHTCHYDKRGYHVLKSSIDNFLVMKMAFL